MARGKPTIGLDIGSSMVKIVQLKEGKKGYRLVNFGMVALPPEAIVDGALMNTTAIVEVIKELLASTKIKGKEVSIGLSGHSVIIKKIALPVMSQEELEESIHWEAEQYIPFDINDVNVDVTILNPQSTVAGQMDVLLVAAKKEMIHDYSAVVQEAGLTPVVVDVDVYALQNAFELNYDLPLSETVVLCNVGASTTNMNVISNGISAFTRDISMGGNQLTEEIQKQLNVSLEEAEALKVGGAHTGETDSVIPQEVEKIIQTVSANMALELQRSIDFYTATSADSKIARVYICGGTAKIPSLQKVLESRLGIPVELLDPFRKIEIEKGLFNPEYLREVAPIAAISVGLGIRSAGDK
jgi:type IV pilus assembly protein PilM